MTVAIHERQQHTQTWFIIITVCHPHFLLFVVVVVVVVACCVQFVLACELAFVLRASGVDRGRPNMHK